jgi:hypothetical protein
MTSMHDSADIERAWAQLFNKGIDLFPVQLVAPPNDPPEKVLLRAILDAAFFDVQRELLGKQSTRSERLLEEDVSWFADTDATYTCSFGHICEELDLSPDAIRSGVFDLLGRRLEEVKPHLYRRRSMTQRRKARVINEKRNRHAA